MNLIEFLSYFSGPSDILTVGINQQPTKYPHMRRVDLCLDKRTKHAEKRKGTGLGLGELGKKISISLLQTILLDFALAIYRNRASSPKSHHEDYFRIA